jgi:hypothetical protein
MKKLVLICAILFTLHGYGQTAAETEILQLSNQIFKWEVENKIDSVEQIFHDKFLVVGSDGNIQTKVQYISQLKSGNFIHDSIAVEENKITVSDNTATAIGKGKFYVTVSGKKVSLHLSFIEVFTRKNVDMPWNVLVMKANVLEK